MWHLVPDRALLPGHRHKMYSDMLYNRTYKVQWYPCNGFVPVATRPMKFNKLNFVRHVAGTKYPQPNISWPEGTFRWNISLGHAPPAFSCVRKCCDSVLATCPNYSPYYMSPECALQKFFCRSNISLQRDPSCLATCFYFLQWVPLCFSF